MGTPDIAVAPLDAIIGAGHDVIAVVSQPDRPKGRGKALDQPEVKKRALELGISVLQPEKATDPAFGERFRELNPDVAVVMAFGQKIPKDMLEVPKHGFINIHASLLPEYRGAAPVQRAIMDGRSSTGVTIMYMNEAMDAGDIGLTSEVPILGSDDSGSLFRKVSEKGSELIIEMLRLLEDGKAPRIPQDPKGATVARKITRQDEFIDWNQEPAQVVNRVRALSPEPGARAMLCGSEAKVFEARVLPECEAEALGLTEPVPGDAYAMKDCSIIAAAGGGWVELVTVRPSGGKTMACKAFARGRRLTGKFSTICEMNEVKG